MIVVLGDVRISPPYSPDSCTGISSTLVARIEKLVSTLCVSGAGVGGSYIYVYNPHSAFQVKRFQDDKTS